LETGRELRAKWGAKELRMEFPNPIISKAVLSYSYIVFFLILAGNEGTPHGLKRHIFGWPMMTQ
jgi:hypothetical protein